MSIRVKCALAAIAVREHPAPPPHHVHRAVRRARAKSIDPKRLADAMVDRIIANKYP